MNPKKFSEAMSKIDSKYIDEAIRYKKSGNVVLVIAILLLHIIFVNSTTL